MTPAAWNDPTRSLAGLNRVAPAMLFVVLLGDDILPWLVLAVGGALAVGTSLALVRPRLGEDGEPLPRPPLARSLVMITLGAIASVWALASLLVS